MMKYRNSSNAAGTRDTTMHAKNNNCHNPERLLCAVVNGECERERQRRKYIHSKREKDQMDKKYTGRYKYFCR